MASITCALEEEEENRKVKKESRVKTWFTLSMDKRSHKIKRRASDSKIDKEMSRRVNAEAKQLAKVCAEISSITGPVRQPRWERPDKKVNIASFLETPTKEETALLYVPAMENTFDLLNVFMRLLVDYLQQIPAVSEHFATSGIVRPTERNFALRSLASMLWSRIQIVYDLLNKHESESNYDETITVNLATQTENVSLGSCENCNASKNLVKNLVKTVEEICTKYDYKSSNVMDVKKEMATDVYYVSQWAATTKWCDAIGKDFRLLSDIAYECLKNNTILRSENAVLQEKIGKTDKAKQFHCQKCDKGVQNCINEDTDEKKIELQRINDQLKENVKIIINLRKELHEERNKFSELKEKCVNFSREINTKKLKIDYLEAELENLSTEKNRIVFEYKDEIALKDVTIVTLNKRIKDLEDSLKISEKEEVNLKEKIDTQQKYETQLWKNYRGMLEENKILKQNLNKNSTEVNLIISKLQDLKGQLTVKSVIRAGITGNPLKDMEWQKTLNEARILTLQEENKDLTKTIIRMYAKQAAIDAVSEAKTKHNMLLPTPDSG